MKTYYMENLINFFVKISKQHLPILLYLVQLNKDIVYFHCGHCIMETEGGLGE